MANVETEGAGSNFTARRSRLPKRTALIVIVVVAAVAGFLVMNRRTSSVKALTTADVVRTAQSVVDKAAEKAAAAPARSVAVYKAIVPSLVVIRTDEAAATADAVTPGTKAFASPTVPVAGEKKVGLGTGVIINDEGSILTANHVVAGAKTIHLTFADGTSTTGSIVSQEPEHDIAVLMPDKPPSVIVPAVMGGGVQVGDETYAVGHPLGLTGSLSAGVVSGIDRSIRVDNGALLEGLIQFDAAVNPGNSGGPLLNRNGQVVGIVTGLANPSEQGFFVGIGFAVPIETAGGAAGGPPQ